MDYRTQILGSTTAEEIDQHFKKALNSAGADHSAQVTTANTFCSVLEALMTEGKVSFPSGGVDFLGFGGGRIPMFRPNTVVTIKK